MTTDQSGRNYITGQYPWHTPEGMVPRDVILRMHQRARTRDTASEYPEPDPPDRIRRSWPLLVGGVGALFIVYSVTAGTWLNASRLTAPERAEYIAAGLPLLVAAAVVALRRMRSLLNPQWPPTSASTRELSPPPPLHNPGGCVFWRPPQ
jgi:hypothetical protein